MSKDAIQGAPDSAHDGPLGVLSVYCLRVFPAVCELSFRQQFGQESEGNVLAIGDWWFECVYDALNQHGRNAARLHIMVYSSVEACSAHYCNGAYQHVARYISIFRNFNSRKLLVEKEYAANYRN